MALMEPFQHFRHIERFRRRLGMRYAHHNCNGTIWFFINNNTDVEVIQDTDQQITVKPSFQEDNKILMTTMIYAKCEALERINLWDNLCNLADQIEVPWFVGGNFNVIMNEYEKIGGLLVYPDEYEDFAFCVNSCKLFEVAFKMSLFIWWNDRAGRDCIFKRLDRILTNSKLQDWFSHKVEHLSRTGFDHASLLLTCGDSSQHARKPLRFLKVWIEHESFLEVVNQGWNAEFEADELITFKLKLKKLVVREDIVRVKEQLFEDDPSPANKMVLQPAQAELKKYMHYEEEFWRQKSQFTYFSNGDRNTMFLHNMANGRRKRFQIKRIKKQDGSWIEGEDALAKEATQFYHYGFTQEDISSNFSLLQHVPNIVTQENNQILTSMPTLEDIKKAIFDRSGDSSGGPDGMIVAFYQVCWDIVGSDVYNVVKLFFEGQNFPMSITHTNLVLIPKKNNVETFADMRPISLSNFINKVISRVVQNKLENVVPTLVSANQSGFVKGRCIIENVL
ncbi:uncharacterized protein LOC132624161 [Lycium barbarum]|uniref:uncharacterized protein LOC132624161 n=1 Tax=Lycium barbarum TaxID=112863 RepID=UPI00293F1191|nr:uncharacterized protein LOC132624161 [Lycium barbarum]